MFRLLIFLLKCMVGLFAAVGFLGAALIVALSVFVNKGELPIWSDGLDEVPQESVLLLDLADGIIELPPGNPLAKASLGNSVVLRDAVAALEVAAKDPRVKGLIARLGRGEPGLARVQELRNAVGRFRASGKPALAFAESFGEGGNGTLHYYLASGFEAVWLQPSGDLDLTGTAIQSPFLREVLDDIGVLPRLDQREDFKGAMNTFTDRSLPEPQRRNLQKLVDSWLGQIAGGIAEARGLDPEAVQVMVNRAPYRATEAKELGLVDRLGYWDQISFEALQAAGTNAEFVSFADYADLALEEDETAPVVALIHGLGPVVLDGSRNDPVFDDLAMGSDTVAQAFADAIDDEEVKAIVFRVDSPGGSYVASDTIWREVSRAHDLGLPVIVTMGDVAASGGYFVSAAAEKIVAQPGTVTGSIGVVTGKFVLNELWDDIGVSWDGVRAGRNAEIWSPNQDFTPGQWIVVQKSLDAIYDDFLSKVADGRDLSREEARAAAQGQVWSGQDAKELGLVDELGGYSEAFALARTTAGLDEDQALRIRVLPEESDPVRAFFEESFGVSKPNDDGLLASFARGLARLARAVAPVLDAYDKVTGDPRSQRLSAPELVDAGSR